MFKSDALWKNKHMRKILAVCCLLCSWKGLLGIFVEHLPVCYIVLPLLTELHLSHYVFSNFLFSWKSFWSSIYFCRYNFKKQEVADIFSFYDNRDKNISINLKCWQPLLSSHYFIEAVAPNIQGKNRIKLFIQLLALNQGLLPFFFLQYYSFMRGLGANSKTPWYLLANIL